MGITALQVHTGAPPEPHALAPVPPARLGLLRPLAAPADVLRSQEEARVLVQETLKEGRDYGKIPGVDKPSLLKPGAERLNLAFGCAVRFRLVASEVEHDRVVPWRKVKAIWEGPKGNRRKTGEEVQTGESLGLYRYVFECEIVHRESGHVIAACIASCSSMESKYIDRPRDSENTIMKMAEKRALVGATLLAYGLSEQFTQDVEDLPRGAVGGDTAPDGAATAAGEDAVPCPKCQGAMWDNRAKNDEREAAGKKRMPDYKCKDQKCEAVIWSAREYAEQLANAAAVGALGATSTAPIAETPAAATEYQVTKILELCDHAAIEEALAEKTRARVKAGVTSAYADRILVGLETTIKKATPAPVAAGATESDTIHALTKRYQALLANERVAPNAKDAVQERVARSDLTPLVLQHAITALEDAECPF